MLRIANTYDWMIATAASRIRRRICAVISTVNNVCLRDGPLLPSKVSSKCPAIMFAVNMGQICELHVKDGTYF